MSGPILIQQFLHHSLFLYSQLPKEQKSLQKFRLPLDLLSQITFLSRQSLYAGSVLGQSNSDLFLAGNLGQELFSKLLLALSCKTANPAFCTVQSQLQHCRSTKCQQQNAALVVRIQEKKSRDLLKKFSGFNEYPSHDKISNNSKQPCN